MSQEVVKKINLKICIVGNSGVGKTSLILRYVKGKFNKQYRITVGADLFSYEVSYEGKLYLLQLWDTAGQERFQTIGTAFYRGSDACIIVYDVTDPKSFTDVDNWKREFIKQGGIKDPESFPFILLGNKSDREADRKVDRETVRAHCTEAGFRRHFETSAQDDLNVREAFLEVVKHAAERLQDDELPPLPQITLNPQGGRSSGGCC